MSGALTSLLAAYGGVFQDPQREGGHVLPGQCRLVADSDIGTFDSKYHYNYWRPITAIRAAATDGNPDTSADPTWTPLLDTPPIPDYDSGHSVEGGAGAQVLKRFFGTDTVSFTTCSTTLPAGSTCNDASPVTRSYSSFSQAADENGLSRILVGYHFRDAVTTGIKHGRKIGNRAVNRFLRPVHHHGHDSEDGDTDGDGPDSDDVDSGH